ncbi:hypothetical protein J7T55_008416 [Diaporthe amygdali]|uniref:uncharacterized protein n=1 Tax=Phomopsis amygdali TaxID=1214568 RepID=UPI0022FDEBEC|nr:uncharacterized protein J7T55_008416 [Diaporthe amygdali]KAJ0121253.1 hypothetical protein J7T55_008416 [Diaporthe amygdali]
MDDKEGTVNPLESDARKPSAMANKDDPSATKQEEIKQQADGMARIASDFTDTVTIRAEQKFFKVPRALLIATSVFFAEELNQGEPKKFFLVLDDLDVELFNIYVNLLFESAFAPKFRIRGRHLSSARTFPGYIDLLLRLWQLCLRFRNSNLRLCVEEALMTQYFGEFTAEQWETVYVKFPEAHMRQLLSKLQRGYTMCVNESIPFAQDFVTACAKCPGQVVATCFDHLDPGFKAEVVKAFALRVADPKVTQRKRRCQEETEPKVLKKRQSSTTAQL